MLMEILEAPNIVLLPRASSHDINEGIQYLDNGARNHITRYRCLFQELNEVSNGIMRM